MPMSATRNPRRAKPAQAKRFSLWLALQTGPGIRELPDRRPQLRRWALAALRENADLSLRFVGRAEAQKLNREYRGRDYAPDVLTFTYPLPLDRKTSGNSQSNQHRLGADIVICVPVLRDQARNGGIPVKHRLAHLIIHGVLHAQGFDHEDDESATVMQAIEIELLRRFKISDPYR
jgi:probable rRNA maturation factor